MRKIRCEIASAPGRNGDKEYYYLKIQAEGQQFPISLQFPGGAYQRIGQNEAVEVLKSIVCAVNEA